MAWDFVILKHVFFSYCPKGLNGFSWWLFCFFNLNECRFGWEDVNKLKRNLDLWNKEHQTPPRYPAWLNALKYGLSSSKCVKIKQMVLSRRQDCSLCVWRQETTRGRCSTTQGPAGKHQQHAHQEESERKMCLINSHNWMPYFHEQNYNSSHHWWNN